MLVWFGRDLQRWCDSNPATPSMARDTSLLIRLLKTSSILAFNTSRDGTSTTFLGNLFGTDCMRLSTLKAKNFFLTSSINLPSDSLKPFSLVDDYMSLQKAPLQLSIQPFLGTGRLLKASSEPSPVWKTVSAWLHKRWLLHLPGSPLGLLQQAPELEMQYKNIKIILQMQLILPVAEILGLRILLSLQRVFQFSIHTCFLPFL